MEKKIIFATGNAGKMREIRAILSDLGLPVLSMKEAGVDLDIVEDGKTFAENAKIKAMAILQTKRALRSFPSAFARRSMIFRFLIS